MRIGILTFHRAHNYGAVLQCYALQQYLIQEGYDAFVIDYNNNQLWAGYNWRDKEYEKKIKKNIIKLPICLFNYIKSRYRQIIRYYRFIHFQEHELRLKSKESILTESFDLILIGSDQVWNTSITHGIDPYYWGVFERHSSTKVATYAASLRGSWKEDQYEFIYEALKKLDGISVREDSVKKYVNKLFPELTVKCVPDPVFLISSTQWKAIAKKPKTNTPYAFFYQAETSESNYKTALEIAMQKELPLYVLSADQWAVNSKKCHSSSPQEFLGWILNAKIVITSSFHALAFCIIFEKDFYGLNLSSEKDYRLKNIASMFGLEERLIDNSTQCKKNSSFSANKKMELIKKKADDYISFLANKR